MEEHKGIAAAQDDVANFHRVMDIPLATSPGRIAFERALLRAELMREEFEEVRASIEVGSLVGIADGLADLIYVALGTAVEYGIDLGPVWDEVQRSNMAKAGGKKREDGKQLKPEGWQPPDIAGVLRRQGWKP